MLGREGDPLTVSVELPGRDIKVDVWTAQVGRVPVLLLDTDNPDNDPADRPITHILYVRGREMRLHQELVLGVGGVRALRALGIEPAAWHLNEGHSAFLLAERARELVKAGDDARRRPRRRSRATSVFTIHTPVSAGNERFDADLVRRVAGPILDGDGRPNTGGLPVERIIEIGRGTDNDPSQFDMTAFSLRLTNGANAVSKLHAVTANSTWREVIPRERSSGSRTASTRRRGSASPVRELFERTSTPTSTTSTADRGNPLVGAHRAHPGGRAVGGAHPPEARARLLRRGPAASQFARHGEAPRTLAAARRRARSEGADDRLRPALRDVQARRR